MERGREFTILTNDPSMTAWGYTVLNHKNQILEVGCIKTEAQQKVRRIRKGDDTVRRLNDIVLVLQDLIKRHYIQCIVSELPHGSQNASAAQMLGAVTGVLQTVSTLLEIPIEWYSEADAKKAVLGKRSATKEEMIEKIDKLYKVPWTRTKFRDEAIADSLAIHYVACQQSPLLKMIRK
jgi:Holliday junction resolvasome RuvABC endonuclease subunit